MQTYPSILALQQRYCTICGELVWTKELIDVVCEACTKERDSKTVYNNALEMDADKPHHSTAR